jgi:lipoprotein-anchoring transpeptidase ErfK/SrfK
MTAKLTGCFGLVLLVAALVAPAADARAPSFVHSKQELAVLLTSHKVVSSLGAHPAKLSTLSASRPLTGGPTVVPVIGHRTKDGVAWLRVMLPGRPNGSKGWIRRLQTEHATTSWHVLVRTSSRRVRIYHRGHLARTFTSIVGAPSTPTPRGRFFVEESVRMPAGSAGGPFALALSARSNVLQEFEGGPGQIALHGVENLGGTFGTASSHGCVRLTNRAITWLVGRVGPGAPVTITR